MTDATTPRPILNGRYELHRRLARGGMADVFLAHDQLLDRPVAIKVLFPQFASEPAFVERFRREAQAAANLNHPSIVAVYDWGEHDNTYFIVMEYVEGRSLAEIVRSEGTLHPDRAAEVATDVAAALGFAHRNGVVHRDVKGGNILVNQAGQVKVTDFGIARAFGGGDELTQTGSVMGTATYFSPEQAQGKTVDPRSDLYSLGVVLFEMVTGRPPFVGDSPVAIAYKHVQEAPPRPTSLNPALPQALEAIIARLLAKNPDDRYPSAEELRSELRRFREGQPLQGVNRPGAGVVAPMAGAAPTTATRAEIDQTRAMLAVTAAEVGLVEEDYYEPPRHNGMFLVALAGLIVLLGGLFYYVYNQVGAEDQQLAGATIPVPNVVGETKESAERLLREAGFVPNAVYELKPDVPVDEVFEQSPEQSEEALEDSTVTIKVSQAAETVTLTEVRGLTEEEATSILTALGLRIDYKREADDLVPEGTVISMNPLPGEVNPEALITLTISTGPAEIEVPQLAGLTVQEASNLLGQRTLPNPLVVPEPSATVTKGLVIRSDPEAGTAVSRDRQITLYVSDGPETALVPPVVGLTQAAAEQAIINRGFTPRVEFVDVPFGSDDDGKVTAQDPAANTKLEKGAEVIIRVGREVAATTTSTTAPTTTTHSPPTTGE
ncbi:MAG: Stk1 family PASTA domain-containing Ser/Thr kinase [Actinomycetota bacterium]|nr:Stk1 family PASTA domain-containing Ser/Thr kinase [Actinomycetota bacterium]